MSRKIIRFFEKEQLFTEVAFCFFHSSGLIFCENKSTLLNKLQPMHTKEENRPGIDVLNTGYGDFELSFNPDKPDEVQKAKETITDMLKRGYAIFIRQGEETFRVRKFDVNKNVYIIGSTPAEEIPMAEARVTAVGRSAGG
jgi:hypothetical protein